MQKPSVMACALDNDDCPPDNTVHDNKSYPAYYDAPYFRRSRASVYEPTSTNLAGNVQHENPSWFLYTEACYRDNLQSLPASVLTSSARPFVRRRDDANTKEIAIRVILAHFFQRRAELLQISDDLLFAELSDVSLPDRCIRSRGAVIAAHFVKHTVIRLLLPYALHPLSLHALQKTPSLLIIPPLLVCRGCVTLSTIWSAHSAV